MHKTMMKKGSRLSSLTAFAHESFYALDLEYLIQPYIKDLKPKKNEQSMPIKDCSLPKLKEVIERNDKGGDKNTR